MNKNLRDYINLVEEITGAEPAGIDWIKSKLPNVNLPNVRQLVPGMADQVKSSDPTHPSNRIPRTVPTTSAPATTTTGGGPKAVPTTKRPVPGSQKTAPVKPKTSKPGATSAPTAIAKKSAAGTVAGATAGQAAKAKTPAASPTYSGSQYGFQSPEDVKGIQQMLVNMGYAMPVDGKWGPKTDAAFKTAYQQMYGTAPGQPATAPTSAQPDAWTKAQTAKPGQSADMAAAVGMPNPYIKESVEVSRIKDLVNYKK